MYQVSIINDDKVTIINDISVEHESDRIDCNFKLGINTIDSCTFTITPSNSGFDLIYPLKTLIDILNVNTNEIEYKGRVLLIVPSMDSNGLFQKKVICESEMGYLLDSRTRYGEYHDISVKAFLKIIIDNHNKQTSPDKHFELGIVEVEANLYRFLEYDKTFEAIKDKLIDRLGGELQIRNETGIRYLDYILERGTIQDTEIRLSKNLISIEKEIDPSNVISRLVPLGAKKEDTEERTSIVSVNNGLDYIDDIEAISKFGIIEDVIIWDDVTIPDNLLRKAIEKQNEGNRILKKHKIEALDLSTIGLDISGFNICNRYKVFNPVMGIDETLRVIEKTVDINTPQNSTLIIGDKFEDIKNYNSKTNKAIKGIEKLGAKVNTTIEVVSNVNTELNNTVTVVNNTVEILNNTNENIKLINSNLIDVSTKLQENIAATNNLFKLTNTIAETLSNTNSKLEKLKRRTMLGV